ncbi:MAG: hypothetical protein WD907_03310 [Bacilli bacterium]
MVYRRKNHPKTSIPGSVEFGAGSPRNAWCPFRKKPCKSRRKWQSACKIFGVNNFEPALPRLPLSPKQFDSFQKLRMANKKYLNRILRMFVEYIVSIYFPYSAPQSTVDPALYDNVPDQLAINSIIKFLFAEI